MITATLALALEQAGLRWEPHPGDRFMMRAAEMGEEVFHLADMAVEAHDLDTGIILAFNGTTEWALDSVAVENTIWLPRETQLREALGDSFVSFSRERDLFTVRVRLTNGPRTESVGSYRGSKGVGPLAEIVDVTDADAESAYARAVLRVLRSGEGR